MLPAGVTTATYLGRSIHASHRCVKEHLSGSEKGSSVIRCARQLDDERYDAASVVPSLLRTRMASLPKAIEQMHSIPEFAPSNLATPQPPIEARRIAEHHGTIARKEVL